MMFCKEIFDRPSPYTVLSSNHSDLGYTNSQLMLYREIIAVCSQIHTKHIKALCVQNVGFANVN